ncbi:MAG: tetratricopeptide repeat protein [Deltaproteobacteria bacterium]|nr:tetratricopeptide repeat protein [Deltaproteobacteria bacterium]
MGSRSHLQVALGKGRLQWTLAALGLLLLAPSARADDDRARAEMLFEAATQLWNAGKKDKACEMFAAAVSTQPSAGGRLNLGRCHEQAGRTASAWREYSRAAAMAKLAGQAEREAGARELAARIEPKLSKLSVQPAAAGTPGLKILCDDTPLDPGSYGMPEPVDPGEHRVEASAPGRQPWSATVIVGPAGDIKTVIVPELGAEAKPEPLPPAPVPETRPTPTPEPAPAPQARPDASAAPEPTPAKPPAPADTTAGNGTGLRIAGFAVGGAGLVAVGVGAVLGAVVLYDAGKVEHEPTLCPNRQCTPAGETYVDAVSDKGTAATVLLAAGGVALAGGAVLVLTAGLGSGEDTEKGAVAVQLAPIAGPQVGGAMLRGTF